MKHTIQAAALLVLGFGLAGCTSDSPASPSAVTTETFRAALLTANEVPPIANDEAEVVVTIADWRQKRGVDVDQHPFR